MSGFKREFQILRSSFSLSIAVHVLFLFLCIALITQRAAQVPVRRTTFIDLAPLPEELLKKLKDETKPNQRIVQTTPGQKTDKAAPDAFLGERTQTVDRQTVSKDKAIQIGETKTTATPHETNAQAESKRSSEKIAQRPVAVPLQSLGLPILPNAKQLDDLAQQRSKGEDRSEMLAKSDQAPKDYVQGMKEGETTALNTREFMFFGYYQRIRERLDRAWVPILRGNIAALYRKGRSLASEMDYNTKVLVVMNRGGEIVKVQVMNESGAHDLDDAAVRAFNKAGPFPNPPTGMIDRNGEIKIPWEFILRT